MKNIIPLLILTFSLFVASTLSSQASIIYVDIKDTSVAHTDTLGGLKLNLDGDTAFDIHFQVFKAPDTTHAAGILDIGNNRISGGMIGIVQFALEIQAGDSISPHSNLWASGGPFLLLGKPGGTITGDWNDGQDHYLGLVFQIGNDFHYSWLLVNIDPTDFTVTVKEYAYESTPGAKINAGDKGVSSVKQSFANPASLFFDQQSRQLIINDLPALNNQVQVITTDMNGRVVFSTQLQGNSLNRIQLPKRLASGVYAFRLVGDGEVLATEKLFLK